MSISDMCCPHCGGDVGEIHDLKVKQTDVTNDLYYAINRLMGTEEDITRLERRKEKFRVSWVNAKEELDKIDGQIKELEK